MGRSASRGGPAGGDRGDEPAGGALETGVVAAFALTGKAKHAARCETGADCVMFVQALSPWDVVPEK